MAEEVGGGYPQAPPDQALGSSLAYLVGAGPVQALRRPNEGEGHCIISVRTEVVDWF